MNNDPSIDILTQRLAEADIDPQLRDALASDLDWAVGINGNPDPSMQGVKRLVVCGVRRELLACDRDHKTQVLIAGIVSHCREIHGEGGETQASASSGAEVSGKMAVFMSVVKSLTPWRWPLAIVCFSPNAVELVRIAIAAFAKQ